MMTRSTQMMIEEDWERSFEDELEYNFYSKLENDFNFSNVVVMGILEE